MATWPRSKVDSLRGQPGLTDIRSAGIPAAAPGGTHSRMPGFPAEAMVSSPDQAERFVAARVADGSDYIKVIAENPGPDALDQPTLDALVAAAHAHSKLTVAHAATFAAA